MQEKASIPFSNEIVYRDGPLKFIFQLIIAAQIILQKILHHGL